jgi:hypothetical protein
VWETALRLDPLSKPAIRNYVMNLILTNRLDDAERELEKIAAIYPAEYADLNGELASIHWKCADFVLGILNSLYEQHLPVLSAECLTSEE